MNNTLEDNVYAILKAFNFDYEEEVTKLVKSKKVSEEELESKAFLDAVLLLVAEKHVPFKSKARKLYDNLKHL